MVAGLLSWSTAIAVLWEIVVLLPLVLLVVHWGRIRRSGTTALGGHTTSGA
jgi:hypothetical protein